MAGIETYGGCCPKCLKGMEQKYNSSWSGFMFDGCPHCGFIYVDGEEAMTEQDIETSWKSILDHYQVSTRAELVEKYHHSVEYIPLSQDEFYPSLFDYSKDEGTLLMYKLLMKKYDPKVPGFGIEGQRVYWHENKEQEGTLMEFKDGKVFILWDEHKGSKLPYCEYPATEVGQTVLLVNSIDEPPAISEDEWSNEEVFERLNDFQKRGVDVRELREKFMDADMELFVATESNDTSRLNKAQERIAEIVDEIRQLPPF